MTYQPILSGWEDDLRLPGPAKQTALLQFPNVDADTLTRHGKQLGRSGELLVESTLCRVGIDCHLMPEHLAYDCVIFHGRLTVRVQVKTAARPRDGRYHYSISKGYRGSPSGVRRYDEGDYDLLALVGLQDNVVKFSADRTRGQFIGLDEVDLLRRRPAASYLRALGELGLDGIAASAGQALLPGDFQ
jgi:hypothetical protein